MNLQAGATRVVDRVVATAAIPRGTSGSSGSDHPCCRRELSIPSELFACNDYIYEKAEAACQEPCSQNLNSIALFWQNRYITFIVWFVKETEKEEVCGEKKKELSGKNKARGGTKRLHLGGPNFFFSTKHYSQSDDRKNSGRKWKKQKKTS